MAGIPPFNDATPDLVFNNILNLNIEWPEGEESLSQPSMEAILAFLRWDGMETGKSTTEYKNKTDKSTLNIFIGYTFAS